MLLTQLIYSCFAVTQNRLLTSETTSNSQITSETSCRAEWKGSRSPRLGSQAFSGRHASAVWADDSSASDGCDSCFAAAWRTRSFTAVVEGDVGRPTLFGSIFLAAHDTASAPTLTGDSNSLSQESRRETCNHLFVVQEAIPKLKTTKTEILIQQEKKEFRVTYFRSCSKSSERSYVENRK
jgi:hypothetical protein